MIQEGTVETSASQALAEAKRDLQIVTVFWALSSVAGGACLVLYSSDRGLSFLAGVTLWAMGISTVGATVGFLFGIPKVLQQKSQLGPSNAKTGPEIAQPSDAPTSSAYAQRVNTNLEDISDWLTKILVGVGLVEFKELPPVVNGIAERIHGPQGGADHSMALALIIFFACSGFLFGYLITRLYLQGALARADLGASQETAPQKRAHKEMEEIVKGSLKAAKSLKSPVDEGEGKLTEKIKELATEYLTVRIPDYRTRLKKKNQLAAQMREEAITNAISKDELATSGNQALFLTLADLIIATPEEGDLNLISRIKEQLTLLHVKFRIVTAIRELQTKGLLSPVQIEKAAVMLAEFEDGADKSLVAAIEIARRSLGRVG